MKCKRFIAALMACIMILGCMPVTSLATDAQEFAWLSADQLTGYADSVFGSSDANYALDDDHSTNWHTNYNEPDGGTSDDPFVEGIGGSLTGNNNFYIVLSEKMSVDKLAFYLDARNANIKTVNVYVSSEDYGENKDIAWGNVIATGDWALSGGRTEELAFPAPEADVKTIRLEITEVHGNTNIRGIDFYVSGGKPAAEEPDQPGEGVEYEFANIDSTRLTAYADSTCLGSSPSKMVDDDLETQWHTNYPGDEQSEDPFVEGSGGNLTGNNNIYIVLDEAMPVNQLSLYTNYNPNAQILAVNVYVSAEEYTKGASLDWGEVVGSSDWALLSGPGGRDLELSEIQYNVKSIRIEVTKVNGNTNIRCSEVYVSVGTAKAEPDVPEIPTEPVEYEYAFLKPEEMAGYADSVFGSSDANYALDDDHSTNWHTNYNEPDGGTSEDPFVEGVGGSLTGNNNFYIVLNEKMPVDKLAFYLDERNANIKTVNVYVSDKDYAEDGNIDWGGIVATGDWGIGGGRIEELAFPAPEMNVKTIRLEITEVHGNTNIRGIDFYVSGGKPKAEPEVPDVPQIPTEPVEYEFANIDSSRLTAYADSTSLGTSPSKMVDGDLETQWHTNYPGEDSDSGDPFVEGNGGNLTGNNNIYIVLDEAMPVNQLSLYTNANPNAQMLSVNVYVSSEEYTKGAQLDWGAVVGSSNWTLLNGAGGRDLAFDEIQYNVRSIRIEVTRVNGNNNIRCSEVYVSVGTPKEITYEYAYLTPEEVTGYADSVFGNSDANFALDDDHSTNWHTNYNEPDGGTSDDPFVEGIGGSLTGNNNFYIVLNEKMPVDKLAFYLDERNANIKTVNVYVSSEDYGENENIDWGAVVATGDWALSGGRIEELAFPAPEMNVKTIRLEITEVHGNTNIRGIDFYVSGGKPATDEPEQPEEPEVPGEKPLFTLAVLADPHIDAGIERWDPPIRTSVTTTVNEMAKSEDVDLVAFPGDIVSSHLGGYWGSNPAQKQQTFENVKAALMDAVNTATDTGRAVFVAGNHDLRVGMLDFNSGDYSNEMEPVLGELIPAESVDDVSANAFYQKDFPAGTASTVEHVLAYHYNVDGLDFIMLNPPFQMDENVYYYDLEALQWVANKMADIGDDQTVFLVGHYPLQDGKDGGIDTDAETHRVLKEEILNNYPKAIYVYGHYHTQVVYSDTYERLNTYMSDGSLCLDRDAVTDGFITVSGGSMAYYGDAVTPSGGLGAATPNVVQALLVYVYADRIVFQMKNYGTENFGVEEIRPYVVYRDVAAEDDVSGLKEALREALKAAEEAQAIAEEAKQAAEDAYAKAEAAQAAAEEAARTSAENTEAARKAKEAAEAAQAEAETTAQAAQTAAEAAEAAKLAAEDANVAAAQEALKAAQEAANAAASARTAAAEAAKAAEAQAKAQEAQAKAEAAQQAAEEAKARADAAKAAAEEAEQSSAEDKVAAEAARSAAEAALAAAEAAQQGAQTAATAAETAAAAADNANMEAAAEALKAAEAAAEAAAQAVLVAEYAASAAEAQAKAQEAQAKAEEAQRAAEEAREKAEQIAEEARLAAELESAKQDALMQIMLLNMETDTDSMGDEQLDAYKQAVTEAIAAITAAEDQQTVADALAELQAAVEEILNYRCAAEVFTDVEADAWYHEYVDFMVQNGYMNGVSDTLFDVSGTTTRGQLVTILYRIAGEPSVDGMENPFADVEAGFWYTDAIIWAANAGVVNGMSETQFMPNEMVTRQQIVTILYRYAKAEPVSEDHLTGFTDADLVADFARDAMNWAVGEGLVNGVSDTLLAPNDTAIRVQICAIVMRFLEK